MTRAAVVARRARLPRPEFQPDLPVNERRADFDELIEEHQKCPEKFPEGQRPFDQEQQQPPGE